MHGFDGRYFVPGMPVRVKFNPKNNTLRTTIVLVLETPTSFFVSIVLGSALYPSKFSPSSRR